MLRRLVACLACLLPLLLCSTATAAEPEASIAASCSVAGKERKLGATYVTALSTSRVSCRTGERVVRAFHECRRRKGAKGRCTSRVRGYRCTERRFNVISTQYDAKATCKRGGRTVRHTYQQFT